MGAAFLLAFYKITTYDVFWHLKTGQVILEEGRLVTTNLFASTYPDHPWPNPEWLFQVLLALLHGAGGWEALSLLKISLVLLIAGTLGGSMLALGAPPLTAAALTVFSLCAMQFRFTMRPHLFSYLFLLLLLLILRRHRRDGGRAVWLLPPLFALWSNIHPELIIGLLVLGAAASGDLLESFRGAPGSPRWDRSLVLAALLCLPATLLNPEGHHVLVFPFLHTFLGPVIEVEEYAGTTLVSAPLFWVFLLSLAALFLHRRRHIAWAEFFIAGGLAVLGLLYLRATPYLFLASAPVFAGQLAPLTAGKGRSASRKAALAAVTAAALALTWSLGFDRLMPYRWGWGLDETDFPAAAADQLASRPFPPRLFNEYSFGGYLLFRLHPAMGVFQDGRVQAYPDDFVARIHSRFSLDDWPRMVEEYDVNTALVQRSHVDPVFSPRQWGVVFWDERWVILVRRAPSNRDFLGEREYRGYLPGAPLDLSGDREALAGLAAEMERNQIERRERSPVTDSNLGVVYRALGDDGKAEASLLRALEASPGYAPAWANLGSLYLHRGDGESAAEALRRALEIDPAMAGARRLLVDLSSRPGPEPSADGK